MREISIFHPKIIHLQPYIELANIKSYEEKINHLSLTPFTPFFSLSSMNNERYSGDLLLRFIKCSKSLDIIFLNKESLLKDS